MYICSKVSSGLVYKGCKYIYIYIYIYICIVREFPSIVRYRPTLYIYICIYTQGPHRAWKFRLKGNPLIR